MSKKARERETIIVYRLCKKARARESEKERERARERERTREREIINVQYNSIKTK